MNAKHNLNETLFIEFFATNTTEKQVFNGKLLLKYFILLYIILGINIVKYFLNQKQSLETKVALSFRFVCYSF